MRASEDSHEYPRRHKAKGQMNTKSKQFRCFRYGKTDHIAKRCMAKYPLNSQASARQTEDSDNESVFSDRTHRNNSAMLNTVKTVMLNRE